MIKSISEVGTAALTAAQSTGHDVTIIFLGLVMAAALVVERHGLPTEAWEQAITMFKPDTIPTITPVVI